VFAASIDAVVDGAARAVRVAEMQPGDFDATLDALVSRVSTAGRPAQATPAVRRAAAADLVPGSVPAAAAGRAVGRADAPAPVPPAPLPPAPMPPAPMPPAHVQAQTSAPPPTTRRRTAAVFGLGLALFAGLVAAWLLTGTAPLHTPATTGVSPPADTTVGAAPGTRPEAALPASGAVAASAAAAPATAATPVAAPAPQPGYALYAGTPPGTRFRLAGELVTALARQGAPVQLATVAPDGVATLQGRLAIVRDDTLRADLADPAAAPRRVLAPLFAEEVMFVVRSDSLLRRVHDLRGQRIGVAPAGDDPRRTVELLLRRLPAGGTQVVASAAPDQALADLVAFGTIDVLAVVDVLPSTWWATLDPATARRLRVLTLDPRHAVDRQLLQTPGLLSARLPASGGKAPRATTPAMMSWLVATGTESALADAELALLAKSLCSALPGLRRSGHPKWRELQPSRPADPAWPVATAAQTELAQCTAAAAPAPARASPPRKAKPRKAPAKKSTLR